MRCWRNTDSALISTATPTNSPTPSRLCPRFVWISLHACIFSHRLMLEHTYSTLTSRSSSTTWGVLISMGHTSRFVVHAGMQACRSQPCTHCTWCASVPQKDIDAWLDNLKALAAAGPHVHIKLSAHCYMYKPWFSKECVVDGLVKQLIDIFTPARY